MFSYAGRKWKIIKVYPTPKYKTIVEPFAGSLSYAYAYWEFDIWAVEKYEKVYRVWNYLQQASPKDILSLPIPKRGEPVRVPGYTLSEEELWLLGFSCNNATASPRNIAGRMGFNSWERDRIRIARDLHKIQHWHILHGSYKCVSKFIPKKATWFIDPPYQHVPPTMGYVHGNKELNYEELGKWCKTRKGQVIVCENTDADWLPFSKLLDLSGQRRRTEEAIWYKES
jgi:site-specific DNA-adenine methylase